MTLVLAPSAACGRVLRAEAESLWSMCQFCGTWQQALFLDTRPARGVAPGIMRRPACHACALDQGMLVPVPTGTLFDWSTVEDKQHRYCWDCVVERFFSHVGKPDSKGRRPWLKERTYEGYGRFRLWIAGKWRHPRAHRVMYCLHNGPIPPRYVIDHTCEHTWCVAPDHLEAVTNG